MTKKYICLNVLNDSTDSMDLPKYVPDILKNTKYDLSKLFLVKKDFNIAFLN